MKTWVVKRVIVAVVLSLTSRAGAKETLDLSKAISMAGEERHEAEDAAKKKLREAGRGPASVAPSREKIVVDLRDDMN